MREVSSIVGLKVVSSGEGREVGTVSQVIVDLSTGVVEGLIVGKGPTEKGIDAADISVIGVDAVMVPTYKVAKHLSELPKLMEKRQDLSARPREVVTDTGKRLGTLGAIYIDPTTKRVTRFEVSGGAWRDMTEGVISLRPAPGTVDGRDTIVVPVSTFEGLPTTGGGLKAQLAKLAELARTQAKQATASLEEGADSVKRGVASITEKAQAAAAKARKAKEAGAARQRVPEKPAETAETPAHTEEPVEAAASEPPAQGTPGAPESVACEPAPSTDASTEAAKSSSSRSRSRQTPPATE